MSFLSYPSPRVLEATAQNRVVVGYAVPPDRVAPLLPDGLAPVERDGTAYVSLVGVELTKMRMLGVVPPGFRRVPAVELRLHVHPVGAPDAEGTWTVQAHTSRRLVAWGARTLYGEPVAVTSMQPIRRRQAEAVEVTYRFDWRGREQRIRVRSDHSPDAPPSASPARMIMAPRWRFSAANQDSVRRTRIERPAPSVCRVQEHHVTVDGPSVYGELGRLIEDRSPAHVLLSPDATVTLRWPERG
jgi:uncharacterized protein YqjF (DUF2071 family)